MSDLEPVAEIVAEKVTSDSDLQLAQLTPEEIRRKEARARQIAALRPFKKGENGGGRGSKPRSGNVAKEAQLYTIDAIDTLHSISKNPKAPFAIRLKAANDLLAWGHGKQRTIKGSARPEPKVPQEAMDTANAFLDEMEQAARDAQALNGGTIINEAGQVVMPASQLTPFNPNDVGQGSAANMRAAFGVGVILGQSIDADAPDDDMLDDPTSEESDEFTSGIE